MLNLSAKAAKYLKVNFKNLEGRDGDYWRLDLITIYRLKYLLCVHEKTLFAVLLRAVDYKTPERIEACIKETFPCYKTPLSLGKGTNRKVTGSILDIRKMILYGPDSNSISDLEDFTNRTPYSYIDYNHPADCMEIYKKEQE